jgi:hypothetical protein
MIVLRKKEAATYSLDGAAAASIKLVQSNSNTVDNEVFSSPLKK